MNTVVHAAVRRDLRRFSAALESFPVGSEQRATDLNRAWLNLDRVWAGALVLAGVWMIFRRAEPAEIREECETALPQG